MKTENRVTFRSHAVFLQKKNGVYETRTRGLLNAIQARSQLRQYPKAQNMITDLLSLVNVCYQNCKNIAKTLRFRWKILSS